MADHWPILPGSERPPEGWPGWPDGKRFAFVLTHDVEGPEGLAKVKPLAELEMSLGFRSSFNFIPEGPYRVLDELRAWLEEHGFEVGVHDLHHDGKLYHTRAGFARKALRINHYLKAWGAAGFRAGFMLHNLDWLHDLDIAYDASTFDTDPFEPQPYGVGTVFPFWVPGDSKSQIVNPSPFDSCLPGINGGYVELPYTLPQDSTLFFLLREPTPEIWLRKLDWIAARGGMVLVNVHPDYLRFAGEPSRADTFPVEHFRTLLEHLRKHYPVTAWETVPRAVATFVRRVPNLWRWRRPLRVAMVTHSAYWSDSRVIRYAEALAEQGDSVEVLGLRPSPRDPLVKTINGVRVHCLQDRFDKGERYVSDHLLATSGFLWKCLTWLMREHRRWPFDLVHVHNVPDFLVFAAWYPRRHGAKVILDIHDLIPELFESKFHRSPNALSIRALRVMERWSARFAHHCIIASDLWLERYRVRTGTNGRCTVFINHVDTSLFRPRAPVPSGAVGPLILFPGSLHWHQGVDVAIRAFVRLLEPFPNAEFHIYGDGPRKAECIKLATELRVADRVKFFSPVPASEIAAIMAQADLGVVPKRADTFGNEAYSTKIMEFMALGVPVVVAETRVDRHYFDDSVVRFFRSGDPEALAEAVRDVLENREATRRRVEKALAFAQVHSWGVRKRDYVALVNQLCGRNTGTVGQLKSASPSQSGMHPEPLAPRR